MKPQSFKIETKTEVDDLIGGFKYSWALHGNVLGYLDLLTGSDQNTLQNAFVEQSTYILIIPKYQSGINDSMRVVDENNRYYDITYVDDPMGQHHHLELYLKYGGVVDVKE